MALIKCPECEKDISDQATNCPQCGYPFRRNQESNSTQAEDGTEALVRKTLLEEGKIAAIKVCREHKPGIGLAAAKAYVERLEASSPPGAGERSRPAGCFGVLLVIVAGAGMLWAIGLLQ